MLFNVVRVADGEPYFENGVPEKTASQVCDYLNQRSISPFWAVAPIQDWDESTVQWIMSRMRYMLRPMGDDDDDDAT